VSNAVAADIEPIRLLQRNHFLLRKLHSLTGIVPVGAFVVFHLFTNMQMAFGTFQHEVSWIHSQPALLFMEIFVLWLPIAFHAALGIIYTVTANKMNTARYPYAGNWRYVLQRLTGIVALLFIFVHIATLRWRWNLGEPTPPSSSMSSPPMASHRNGAGVHRPRPAIQRPDRRPLFRRRPQRHLSLLQRPVDRRHQLGLTHTVRAQKRFGYVCAALFLALFTFSAAALYGGLTYQPTAQEQAAYTTPSNTTATPASFRQPSSSLRRARHAAGHHRSRRRGVTIEH